MTPEIYLLMHSGGPELFMKASWVCFRVTLSQRSLLRCAALMLEPDSDSDGSSVGEVASLSFFLRRSLVAIRAYLCKWICVGALGDLGMML